MKSLKGLAAVASMGAGIAFILEPHLKPWPETYLGIGLVCAAGFLSAKRCFGKDLKPW